MLHRFYVFRLVVVDVDGVVVDDVDEDDLHLFVILLVTRIIVGRGSVILSCVVLGGGATVP